MSFGILAGALLAGAGNAATEVGKQWREDDIRAENRRMELEKEKRIEDTQIRAEDRQQGRQIETEKRGIANAGIMAKQSNEIALEYAPKLTAAKIAEKEAMLPIELKQKVEEGKISLANAIALDKATDHTDYAGRALSHKAANLEIQAKEAELKGMPKQAIDAAKGYIEQAKQLAVTAAGYEINSPQRSEINTQINNLYENANSIYTRFGYGPSKDNKKQAEDTNPFGIDTGKKQPIESGEKTKTPVLSERESREKQLTDENEKQFRGNNRFINDILDNSNLNAKEKRSQIQEFINSQNKSKK